ncbi:hypothetical protein Afil01_19210 [Actinorhabdospora filicis]|uniref:Uncharacterized protein n=1 Tax=Actinorhabdospora filicis TaxID=1785913 RepID=A0A9W6SH97_9ACTN|nr:hypothetical protein [Actinorhabdospora filicis]GLZ77114.1 hypothetical protein Afil01_19210 [Actinorhabdospora filicis]
MHAIGTRDDEVAHYIAAVEDALADMPENLREELLADLVGHLTEIAGEITAAVPLAVRLGPPRAYAAELRATINPAYRQVVPPPPPPRTWRDLALDADRRGGRYLGYARVTDFLFALRPAWWVLRVYAVTGLGVLWVALAGQYAFYELGFVLLLLAVIGGTSLLPLSVRLGRDRDREGLDQAASIVGLIAVILWPTSVLFILF